MPMETPLPFLKREDSLADSPSHTALTTIANAKLPIMANERIDGGAFLATLRAANEATVGTANTTTRHPTADSLTQLFESNASSSPPPLSPQTDAAAPRIALPSRPNTLDKGNRSVSWGQTTVDFKTIQQPQLSSDSSAPTSPTSPSNKNCRKLTLEDITTAGPFEDEVESNLLKALDRQVSQRPRLDTASTIFTQVPEHEVVHDFDVSPMPNTDPDDAEEQEPTERSTSSQRRHLLAQQQQQPSRQQQQQHHRREPSVEQTLLDLTTALSKVHGPRRSLNRSPGSRRLRNASAAEELAENGLLLIDQQSADTPTSLWSKVRTTTLPVLKESNRQQPSPGGTSSDQSSEDDEPVDVEKGPPTSKKNRKNHKHRQSRRKSQLQDHFRQDWEVWTDFFRPRRDRFWAYCKWVTAVFLLPLTGIAAILFYAASNPISSVNPAEPASASWILLFCVRQIITLSMALALQGLVIDFLCLGTKVMLTLVGPILTLLIVQSKGWPFIGCFWGILDLAMLAFDRPFAHHWFFYQSAIGMFNEENPSGHVVDNEWYIRVLAILVCVSVVTAIKRFLVGLFLGRQTFVHFGEPLAKVMGKMLLVSEVAGLAKDMERSALAKHHAKNESTASSFVMDRSLRGLDFATDDDNESQGSALRSLGASTKVIDMDNRNPLTGSLQYSEKLKLMRLLEQWEEPQRYGRKEHESASISAVLRFRRALTFIQKRYPFSHAFGPADDREVCIDSAQQVYSRLMLKSENEVLSFETLAVLCLDPEGNIDQGKAKELMRVFRPDRQGRLTVLDFVKSVDAVYKEFRLLNASIENSSQIDRAFESLFNVVFYLAIFAIVLSQMGIDPFALFLSLSSIILAFAFMISSAASKFFEGVLLVLVRRPYGIGDRIQVANSDTNGSLDGALPWCVENVTLFETEVVFLPTNERASLSNGALANSRIINWARSPQAQFHIFLNFPLDTPYEKIVLFKSAIEEYMKARPREWRALNGFRANRVVANQNYIEYIIVIQHREAWQQVGQVLDSKANLSSYCQEVARQLGMHYQAPRLPVDLKYSRADDTEGAGEDVTLDSDQMTARFQSLARSKHNIRVC